MTISNCSMLPKAYIFWKYTYWCTLGCNHLMLARDLGYFSWISFWRVGAFDFVKIFSCCSACHFYHQRPYFLRKVSKFVVQNARKKMLFHIPLADDFYHSSLLSLSHSNINNTRHISQFLLTLKQKKQVEQSSNNRCVLERTCTSICNINCSFTCTFVLVTLKCITNCLNLTFHTLTYLHFAQKWHFFEISTRVWLTDGRMDGRTDGRTHPLIEMRERIHRWDNDLS